MKKLFILLALAGFACSEQFEQAPQVEDDENVKSVLNLDDNYLEDPNDTWTVNQTNQYALNVVFFLPTDDSLSVGEAQKVSDMMLYIQDWYEMSMVENGFNKTFGLMTNQDDEVRIIVVNGSDDSDYFSNNNSQVKNEVEAFFNNNPSLKTSEHVLVLGHAGSGVPFYGLGKYCFATSSDFTLSSSGKTRNGFSLMSADKLGGIMHELAHGLNLPHNTHTASDLPDISLMSFGNHTYEGGDEDLVYLTAADASILNNNQVFNQTNNGISYYAGTSAYSLDTYSVSKNQASSSIDISGEITSDSEIAAVFVGHDGFPFGGGNNYDKITYSQNLSGPSSGNSYSFSLTTPYSDLFNDYKDDKKDSMQLALHVVYKNGTVSQIKNLEYSIDLATEIPDDNVNYYYEAHDYTDRSAWTLTMSSQPSTISNILDGNQSTFWHSQYPWRFTEKPPHEAVVDMGQSQSFEGVYIYSNRGYNEFRPKHLEVFISQDGTTWSSEKTVSIASTAEGEEISILFDNAVNARYFKIVVDEIWTWNGVDNLIINEIDIL
ncbi:discoidin domain-containing protein [Echinicola sp. CAU 1574]|uniref:Discoidin domain-containing protein n=1 Tax=Echinicola arenosa TaxID=2774144 RepID=A0ABR9AMW1_9BACT|nr:discoidin domain-containing protein [Echinicola arenosa]MBD8490117.1 discoidin domain-containing protein [Echinicola arenosa]